MFRVMIVEDEMLVGLELKSSIEWSKFHMTVTADTADGQSAWKLYLRDKPDLIITGLKIPGMNGMELIEKIREKDANTKIIILTCLEEFDLVRRAMSLGVSDYILKPAMTEEDLEAVLGRVQKELNRQKNDSLSAQGILKLNKEVLKEKMLMDYLFYDIYSQNEFEAYVSETGLRLNPGRLIMCSMEIHHFGAVQSRFKDMKGQLIKSAMLNILDEILCNYSRGEAFCDSDSNYILIFSFHDVLSEKDMYKELYTILDNIRNSLSVFLNVYVSFGVSSLNNGYKSLTRMYNEAQKSLEQKFFQGLGIFFPENKSDNDRLALEKIDSLYSQTKITKILSESGRKDYLSKIEIFKSLTPKNKEQIKLFFSNLIQYLSMLIRPLDENNSMLIVKYNEKLQKSETLDEVIDTFNGFVSEIADLLMKKDIVSKEISLALRFIQNNYEHDINLPQVADYVKLSPNYFGNLFKKELKINFIEYLNELRIEKAKELLAGTYLKSYEIAGRVGFTEHTYFSKVFKKVVGSSPSEFRRNLLRGWPEGMEDEKNWAV